MITNATAATVRPAPKQGLLNIPMRSHAVRLLSSVGGTWAPMWPDKGPVRRLVLTAGVGRSAEESVADEGKYLGLTRSAKASRIVQARLPICAAIVTQFVTHFWRDLGTPPKSRWQSLEFLTPTPGGRSEREV